MIIGIGGEKKHGKDAIAKYLTQHYGFEQYAFADKMKKMVQSIWPFLDPWNDETKEQLFDEPLVIGDYVIGKIIMFIENDYDFSYEYEEKILSKLRNKKHFTSVRDILQFLGTDILRDIVDENYHYNSVRYPIANYGIPRAVISDCRFKNERFLLRLHFSDAKVILVKRPSMVKNATSSHASETSLGSDEEYDHVIINDGTLEDLYAKVDELMVQWRINKK